jgi:subtilisin family serine protease
VTSPGPEPVSAEPIDPGLRQLLLRRTGSTEPPSVGEEADEIVPVIARLTSPGAVVPGLAIVARFGDVVTARVQLSQIFNIRRDPEVVSLKTTRRLQPGLAGSVADVHARSADLTGPGEPAPAGRGVIIAILDWGLDVAHANFRHADGSTRVLALWDQRGGAADSSPSPYGYGRVHSQHVIDNWLRSPDPYVHGYDVADADPHGHGMHGTHVTDIAAGNGRAPGSSPGVAPEADLLFIHLSADDTQREGDLGDSVRLLEAVSWAVETAAGRPLVIHMSLGRTGGPHDASPLVCQALDWLLSTSHGVAAVMSCGNYYETRMHAGGRIVPGGRATLDWEIPPPAEEPSELEIWYGGTDRMRVTLVDPVGKPIADLPPDSQAVVRAADGTVAVSGFHRSNDPGNGAHHVDLFVWSGATAGTYRIVLTAVEVQQGRYDAWIERTDPQRQSRFAAANATPDRTTGSICNGWLPLAVGAYDSRDPHHPPAQFSSRGPTGDDRVKPDVSAPGMGIRAARSSAPLPDGTRTRDALTVMSGTSMAAPHVTGAVALVFETVAGLRLPMSVTRFLIMESARHDPPRDEADRLRYGAGRLDAAAACRLAKALRGAQAVPPAASAQRPGLEPVRVLAAAGRPITGTDAVALADRPTSGRDVAAVVGEPGTGLSSLPFVWDGESAAGQLQVGTTTVDLEPEGPAEHRDAIDDATLAALERPGHALVQATSSGGFDISDFGSAPLPASPVATITADQTVRQVAISAGTRLYVRADQDGPGNRWVDMPGLSELLRLPAADRSMHVNVWVSHAARSSGLTAQQVSDLGVAAMRALLAAHADRAFPVGMVSRENGMVDAGGIVGGITLPMPRIPLSEPQCYLPVIAQVEGRLESINAWDIGAGVSLGPIQFNAQRGALIRFLARFWADDPDLFGSALGRPLAWTITAHEDHADLGVVDPSGSHVLHGTAADVPRLVSYLQSGTVGGAGRDGAWRRRVADCFRDAVAWPHVQDMITDVSTWWLEPALRLVRAEKIGPLDPAHPDGPVFVLTAILLSAAVRLSASLLPLLAGLRPWPGPDEKLAHWPDVLAAMPPRFAPLEPRLRRQQRDAERIRAQIERTLATAVPRAPAAGRESSSTA